MAIHLAVLKIKNSDFNYSKYGLKNNYFSIDISNSVSYSKGIGVTQYAVLDGTTRIDNISKEPGSISLQGLLAEVRAGNNPADFVYDTPEKNRLQNQMDLLEAIRDQAIFLDIITDERTYRNYLITNLSFGKNTLSQIDVNISAKEVIVFGDNIDITQANQVSYISDYERDRLLETFSMNSINSDAQLVTELTRVITASTLSTPFITIFGPAEMNPDVVIPSYTYRKLSYKTLPESGKSIMAYNANQAISSVNAVEVVSGTVVGGNYLQLSFPQVKYNESIYNQKITTSVDLGLPQKTYTYVNYGIHPVHIKLKNANRTVYGSQNSSLIKTPLYSEVVNGVHSLNKVGSPNDIVSEARFGINFVRKQKNNKYTLVPNLLGQDSRGYLYSATYETLTGSTSTIKVALVYIHPEAWKKIKNELVRVWNESSYFSSKTLGGI